MEKTPAAGRSATSRQPCVWPCVSHVLGSIIKHFFNYLTQASNILRMLRMIRTSLLLEHYSMGMVSKSKVVDILVL